MTTLLKDSCRKHSLFEIKCAVEWGPRHVWGFHRQETGLESESPRPSSRGVWGLWCWGPHWSRCARRARIRKVAKPYKLDRSCTALKEAFGSVLSSSCQIIPSPLCSHRFLFVVFLAYLCRINSIGYDIIEFILDSFGFCQFLLSVKNQAFRCGLLMGNAIQLVQRSEVALHLPADGYTHALHSRKFRLPVEELLYCKSYDIRPVVQTALSNKHVQFLQGIGIKSNRCECALAAHGVSSLSHGSH